jgi:hypothetical protein
MTRSRQAAAGGLLAEWNRVPARIAAAIRGLDDDALDTRGGEEQWSIRETVHHLVEANLVASNMIIAALAVDGYEFDWTWVWPSRSWMKRVGYDKAGVKPALAMLRALAVHLSGLLEGHPGRMKRALRVNDRPGAGRYTLTVEDILRHQVEHTGEHLRSIAAILEAAAK